MGKVTVKHYLNKKLKPLESFYCTVTENGEIVFMKGRLTTYPIYIMAVHNRKVKRFKSKIFTKMFLSGSYIDHVNRGYRTLESLHSGFINEDDFHYLSKNDEEFIKFLEYEKKVVHDALLDEEEGKDKSWIKSFQERFDLYITPYLEFISGSCHQEYFATSRKDSDDLIAGSHFTFLPYEFDKVYEAIKHMSICENGSYTPFFQYKEDECKHAIVFYNLYKEYTANFPFISQYHFEKEGHLGQFWQMIRDKNLPEKIYKGCEMFMHYYLNADPTFFDYMDPLHPMHKAE